jgi:uncharacterized membrane protein YozB (DUF420 family)
MQISDLPHLNVSLNALSAVLLTCGYIAIRRKHKTLHKRLMISAMISTAAFLASYLIYHFNIGSKPYTGTGMMRTAYFSVLISHVILAALNLPMVIVTAYRALTGQFEKHKRIARITLPVWWYVSITGVIVYLMLYC